MVNFCLKRNSKSQKNSTVTLFLILYYYKFSNIQKFDGIYIPVKQIVMSFKNSSRP